MKKILTYLLLISLCFGGKIKISRNKTVPFPTPPKPTPNLTVQLVSEAGTTALPAQRISNLNLFQDFEMPKAKRGVDTINVLVLRVEFVADTDSLTTGTGKMDLVGLGTPEDGLFYDPPHIKNYFEHHMQFLSNFYKSNSFGNLIVNPTVKPEQPGSNYQLPHQMRYYSGFDHYDENTGFVYFNSYAMDMGLVRILADAVAAADQDAAIDFSDYDAIIIMHAGTLWQTSLNFMRFCDIPSATIPSGALEFYLGLPYILANAGTDTIWGGSINAEMARVNQYMAGEIGTVVHEFGHVLGLPDLYDITGYSNGVGAWDLMCTGSWVGDPSLGAPVGTIPANLGAWPRYAMGWVNPVVITDPETLITLRASEIDTLQYSVADQTMTKIPISATEYFLIENRQQDIRSKDTIVVDVEDGVVISVDYGEYDFFLPGSGILVWHVDDNVINANWAYNTVQINPAHKGVDLEEADGIQHFDAWWYGDNLEYYGSKYDPFFVDDSNKANHDFGPFTNPNSDSYYGKSLISIDVKSKLDTLMNFSFDFNIYLPGFPVLLRRGDPIFSVSYGDLDHNGDLEIIAITKGGYIYAYNHDGSLYHSTSRSAPTTFLATGDINADSCEDIVFASGKNLFCLNGQNFTNLPNFPFATDDQILGAPLLFDINGDANLEVIFGSKDRKLYCLDASGSNIENFPIYMNTEIYSTPCVFNQSEKQIGVLGSDGRFWLIDKNGIVKEFTESAHNMITYASPVVGDLDRDDKPEAVIINGFGTIYIYGADTLEEKFDILIDTTFYITPALADLDHDGYLEILIPNSSKTLYVCNRNGTSENNFPLHTNEFISYPVLVADLDANGSEEIVFGLAAADSLGSGQLKIINDRNKEFDYSPLFGEGGFSAPGVIFDIDMDTSLELACGTDSGKLYVWDFPINNASWKGFMNSPKNWGLFDGNLAQPQIGSGLLGSCYIYPSPVERNGRVRFFLKQEAEVKIGILDITGHVITSVDMANPTPNEYNEIEIDFSRQSNGVYLLRIEAKNGERREVKFKKFAVLK